MFAAVSSLLRQVSSLAPHRLQHASRTAGLTESWDQSRRRTMLQPFQQAVSASGRRLTMLSWLLRCSEKVGMSSQGR